MPAFIMPQENDKENSNNNVMPFPLNRLSSPT